MIIMALQKFTQYRKRGGSKVRVRFTDGVAYLSAGFIRAASKVLVDQGSNAPGEDIRYVEFFFDPEARQVGIKPVGHKGLSEKMVTSRPGVRKITGTKTKVVSVRGFQDECEIKDQTSFSLVPEKHRNPDLPEPEGVYIIFVSDEEHPPEDSE